MSTSRLVIIFPVCFNMRGIQKAQVGKMLLISRQNTVSETNKNGDLISYENLIISDISFISFVSHILIDIRSWCRVTDVFKVILIWVKKLKHHTAYHYYSFISFELLSFLLLFLILLLAVWKLFINILIKNTSLNDF